MDLPVTRLRNARGAGIATPVQRTSAQAKTSANRMSVLLNRRFRIRAPDAPLKAFVRWLGRRTPATMSKSGWRSLTSFSMDRAQWSSRNLSGFG